MPKQKAPGPSNGSRKRQTALANRFFAGFRPLRSIPDPAIVNCRACRRWCKAAHRRLLKAPFHPREPLDDTVVCVRADDGRGDLRRALAVEPPRACRARRAARRTSTRINLAEIDRDAAAGLIGPSEADAARVEIGRRLLAAVDRRARCPGAVEYPLAPLGRGSGAGRAAGRGGRVLPCAWLAAARRFSAGGARPRRQTPTSRSTIWWRRSRRIWRRTRPTAAAGMCWRRCWCGSAATTTRSAPIAIRSPITATVPSGAPISAKPLRARPVAWSPRRPRPNSIVPSRSMPDDAKAQLLPWHCRRAGRPQRRCRSDLASDAGEGACAMRHGGRWFRPRWYGSAAQPRRRCRMTRWPRPRT